MKHLNKALENFTFSTVKQRLNENGNLEIISEFRKTSDFIEINGNKITFTIQDGVISENGINGIQARDLLVYSLELIKSLNEEFSSRENALTITKLEEAIAFQDLRTINRIKRNVEGKHQS